jgi:hypothetical protein
VRTTTVRDLLDVPALGLAVRAVPDGVGVPVRWAHMTELLDPRPYLRGQELVLTVGMSLSDDERCRAFVDHLVEAGASAVGFGSGDVCAQVPRSLVDACAGRGLPLLEVPHGVPFQLITQLLADRSAHAGQVQQLVTRLLAFVVEGRADPEVLEEEALAAVGLGAGGRVVVAAWPLAVAHRLASHLPAAVVAEVREAAVSLHPDAGQALAVAATTGWPCGVGEPVAVADLRRAGAEAVAALALSRRRGVPAAAADLIGLEALLDLQPPERLAPFAHRLAAPLAAHDREHGTSLLPTLRAFLEHDGAVGATARAMFLHPNALRHRLSRIAELTGRSPTSFADRVALAVGVVAWDRRPSGRHRV